MELFNTVEGLQFILRYFHLMAVIVWVGIMYYFDFIQAPFYRASEEQVESVTRGLMPNALWWFRWGAMFAFVTGWGLILTQLHLGADLAAPAMVKVLTGAIIGSLMWANIWFCLWPIQKLGIASAKHVASGGQPIANMEPKVFRAKLISRTNTLLSIPALFFMLSGSNMAWIAPPEIFLGYIFMALGFIEVSALFLNEGFVLHRPLYSVMGTIHAGVALTAVLYLLAMVLS